MIVDRLAHRDLYRGLPAPFLRALDFLATQNPLDLSLGRHDLDGDRLFALVQEYSTKAESDCRWEAHRRYADVQFVATGRERIGVASREFMQETVAHDDLKDVAFFEGPGDWITLPAGSFAIFWPHDVHRPCAACGANETVRKIVLKVALT